MRSSFRPFREVYRADLRADLRDALALATAVLVVGASFGALAAAAAVPAPLVVAMSVLVFAGGSQFLVVAVVAVPLWRRYRGRPT